MRKMLVALLGVALSASLLAPAAAQKPAIEGPITILVPFGAGNGLDVMARVYAARLSQQMNTSVVVDNREGAGGLIGTMAAMRAAPNGRTVLFTAEFPYLTTPYIQPGRAYSPTSDFAPIAKVATTDFILVTAPNSPTRSVGDIVQFARSNPDKLSFASSGVGTPSQLHLERVLKDLGVSGVHVPYKSTGAATTDVMSGHVHLYFPALSAVMPLVREGKLRALAVGSARRLAELPDVPTLAEVLKQPGFEANVWFGFLAPKGVAPDVVQRLEQEIERAGKSPEITEMLKQTLAQAASAGAARFARDITDGDKRARDLLARAGVSIDK
ncbi:MAG TPA: tripartite tricarboxylate transporter substrate binding protein [Ramlibacter sp.]|nr:tripartite tricarboxylate transporter substrate binding protein [Ramlibacter sp.]